LLDGVYRAETAIDGYLDGDDPSKKELPIVVTITKKDDSLLVDLTGTAPQVPDWPINMPLEGTSDIVIWLTIRSVLLDTEIHGNIPVNAGLIRPITIVAPKGCLANPTFPAPIIADHLGERQVGRLPQRHSRPTRVLRQAHRRHDRDASRRASRASSCLGDPARSQRERLARLAILPSVL
jgi:hypothetical protein